MQFLKIPFLLGALAITIVAANSQTRQKMRASTNIDSFGNVTRTFPEKTSVTTGQSAVEANSTASSARIYRGRGRDSRDRFYPPQPIYPYPAPAPVYNNNYYYPALPSTVELGQRPHKWSIPNTITTIPLGTTYNGYSTPGYPSYPGYPAPPYGYPAPAYGYPAYGGTYYNGVGTGSVYTESQTGGYGLSIGQGRLSVQLGNRRSTTTTTVTQY